MVSCTRLLLAILRHETNWTCCCTINSYHHLSYDDTPILPSLIHSLLYWSYALSTRGPWRSISIVNGPQLHPFSSSDPKKRISILDHRRKAIIAVYGKQLHRFISSDPRKPIIISEHGEERISLSSKEFNYISIIHGSRQLLTKWWHFYKLYIYLRW